MQHEIEALQEELRREEDPNRMQSIQEMISVRVAALSTMSCIMTMICRFDQELLGQMSRIREKATESEAVVRNITKEIQVLDLAKKNLMFSMATLKRLQMLGWFTVV